MKVTVKKYKDLSQDEIELWYRMVDSNPTLRSPYYTPDYCELVSAVLPNTEIALLESDGRLAFFPYQRDRGDIAMPLGYFMTDYQGMIYETDHVFDPQAVVRKLSLRYYHFNHLPLAHRNFQPYFDPEIGTSPIIDFTQGYDPIIATLRKKIGYNNYVNKFRKAGLSLEFKFSEPLQKHLEQIIDWKSSQYRRSGKVDIFKEIWVTQLLRLVIQRNNNMFKGVLSVLEANGQLIAAHLGIMHRGIFHYWFPVYDPDFESYSPGSLLLFYICNQAEKEGIQRLDFGKGDEPYKKRFSNAHIALGRGYVDHLLHRKLLRSLKKSVKRAIKAFVLRLRKDP